MNELKQFRLLTVQLSLLLTAILAAVGSRMVSREAAIGLLGGGIMGVLAFWIIALKLEKLPDFGGDRLVAYDKEAEHWGVRIQGKLASYGGNAVRSIALRLTFIRLGLYAVALIWSYTLDRETLHGFFGAVVGLLIVQGVQLLFGLTGWDQKRKS